MTGPGPDPQTQTDRFRSRHRAAPKFYPPGRLAEPKHAGYTQIDVDQSDVLPPFCDL